MRHHLLQIDDLSREDIERILRRAESTPSPAARLLLEEIRSVGRLPLFGEAGRPP